MKLLGKVYGAAATGLALLAMSGTASALTYQGAVFSSSVSGSGTTWDLTMNMNFVNADPNGEFIGDNMEAWSLTLPGAPQTISLLSFSPTPGTWSIQGNGQSDATGCGGGNVAAICVDYGTANVLNGGGPVIDVGDTFTFVVRLVFGTSTTLLDNSGNFHLLSVVHTDRGCPRGADSCWKKDGGLISQPLTSVPEPGSLALLGLGLVGLGLSRRRRA